MSISASLAEIAVELAKLAGVGLVAGLFSSWLATRDHRDRQYWQLRVDAYRSVIEALSDLVYYHDRHLEMAVQQSDRPEDDSKDLEASWKVAFSRVRRSADAGAFLFSEDATKALRVFILPVDPNMGFVEIVESQLKEAKKCLEAVVACSKKDLKLKRFPWE